jgi:O-antigen/teichoic acid export membrane protein
MKAAPQTSNVATSSRGCWRGLALSGFFWNATNAGLDAIQSAVILLAISRTRDIATAGIIAFGFAVANLVTIIARYGIRNYQVTDLRERFGFQDYFLCRGVTTGGGLFFALVYLTLMVFFGRYSPDKGLVILEIVFLKATGAVEDVFIGRLQQLGRLDIGARIATFRLMASTTVIFASLWVISSLHICLLLGIASEIVLDVLLVGAARKTGGFTWAKPDFRRVTDLLWVGIPLCLGMALHNYVGNAPKYLVDLYLTDDMQAVCGYVMMPMFVLVVLSFFVMQPAVKGLGDAWITNRALFRSKAIRHMSIISVLSVVVLAAGLVIGLPLLSTLYKVDLQAYRKEFMLLMVGGGLYTLSSYMIVLLTTMRRQIGIVWGCLAALLVCLVLGRWATHRGGFTGACFLYILANAAMLAAFLVAGLKEFPRGQIQSTRQSG